MRRIIGFALVALVLCLLTSCMTILETEPTIIGGWSATEGDCTRNLYFTEDGYYVIEDVLDGTVYSTFGMYEAFGTSLYVDGDYDCDFVLDGRTLILGETSFRRTTKKAQNNSDKLAGVWENDYYIIGFATDGLVVSQGSYMNCGTYELDGNWVETNGYSDEYLIVNNNLYLKGFHFVKDYDSIRLVRKSSGGKNKTGMDILCNNGPWFYQDLGSYDLSGVVYSFSNSGSFQGTDYLNGNAGSTKHGTFTLDGNRIRLSTGGILIFAYIDSTPFGYT
ncbi:MAG: hypothetical protein MJ057_05705 [Sphaerochaetaceae bacterium]|nr:hypothetical protein [Sphaerochaetaceae bacterium]